MTGLKASSIFRLEHGFMIAVEKLIQPRPGHGLQAMMRRWENLHPVNAVHVAWLNDPAPVSRIEAAAERVFARLLQFSPRSIDRNLRNRGGLFDFRDLIVEGDWRCHLEQVVTCELNTPFQNDGPPFRIDVINVGKREQFVILSYRHVIADARAVALLLNEIIGQLTDPASQNSSLEVVVGRSNLCELFPAEFQWHRAPAVVRHLAGEWWRSRRCVQLKPLDPNDLHMDFRVHQTKLPLATLKTLCHRHGATVNDLILASVMEWFASWLSDRRDGRPDLAAATLVDLSSRGEPARPLAFGQFVSQFVVRAPVTAELSFAEIVRLVAEQTASQKQVRPLILNSISLGLLARLWDLLPFVRKPQHLASVLPLLAGISNVNLSGITSHGNLPSIVRNYFRGTCVTNLLPMMLSLTSVRETVSLTTTHRPVFFSADQMADLAAHVGRRLFNEAWATGQSHVPERLAA
jgi:hypothetical protein